MNAMNEELARLSVVAAQENIHALQAERDALAGEKEALDQANAALHASLSDTSLARAEAEQVRAWHDLVCSLFCETYLHRAQWAFRRVTRWRRRRPSCATCLERRGRG